MGLDWSIIRGNGPIDFAGNFARGYQVADKIISSVREKEALGDLARDPDDRNALAKLYATNPDTAVRMETMNMKRHEVAREGRSRNALAGLVGPLGRQQFGDFRPNRNALTGEMPEPTIDAPVVRGPIEPAVESSIATGAEPAVQAPSFRGETAPGPDGPPAPTNGEEIVVTGKRQPPEDVTPELAGAWEEYAAEDPEGAFELLLDRQKLNKAQALALGAQYDVIGRLGSTVTDQASLDKARDYAIALGLPAERIPTEYSAEAVERILYQAMTAKEAIKTKHDITDDEIDNARADEALKLRERIAEQASADRRRGQDVADRRGRRGQDIASRDRQRGQDMRPAPKGGKGGGGAAPVRVKSVAEARALPPGTMFYDPNGNLRKR